ncbi:MAG: glycosyl transferase [Gammaproteobacteria bacterium]|nr:glycosyl transferase [Gammaproteobacteria bacterium]
MQRTIVCLNWGTRYGAQYVNKLYHSVARYLRGDFAFFCFTDNDAGIVPAVETRDIDELALESHMRCTVWLKCALLHPHAGLHGRFLFLDLDLVVLNPLDELFDYPGEFCITHNWIERRKLILRKRPDIGNSSVFRFEGGTLPDVAERYLADPQAARDDFPTEQAFLSAAIGERKNYWPQQWVKSYKHHGRPVFPLNWVLRPRLPRKAKLLVFHGRPDIDEAIAGFHAPWHKKILPCPQLAEFWS